MLDILEIFGIVVLVYGIQLYFRQWSLIYRPTKRQLGTPHNLSLHYDDLYLPTRNNIFLHSWWIEKKDAEYTVVYFHGTIGNMSYDLHTILFLNRLGVNTFIIDYPGYGKSQSRPNQSGCLQAADTAWDYLKNEKQISENKIILYGRSIGSIVAAYLASKINCKALVLHSGITSVPDIAAHMYPFLPVRWFCHTRMDILKYIPACTCPILLLHSKKDDFVPVKFAHKVYSKIISPKKMIYILGGHFSNIWSSNDEVRLVWQDILGKEHLNW